MKILCALAVLIPAIAFAGGYLEAVECKPEMIRAAYKTVIENVPLKQLREGALGYIGFDYLDPTLQNKPPYIVEDIFKISFSLKSNIYGKTSYVFVVTEIDNVDQCTVKTKFLADKIK